MPGHTKTEKQEIEQVEFTKQTSGEEMQSTEVSNVNFKKSQKQTSRSPENKLLEVYISNPRTSQYHGLISYSAVVEDRKYLIDPSRNCLDDMIEKELIEELLQTLTERQKEIIYP